MSNHQPYSREFSPPEYGPHHHVPPHTHPGMPSFVVAQQFQNPMAFQQRMPAIYPPQMHHTQPPSAVPVATRRERKSIVLQNPITKEEKRLESANRRPVVEAPVVQAPIVPKPQITPPVTVSAPPRRSKIIISRPDLSETASTPSTDAEQKLYSATSSVSSKAVLNRSDQSAGKPTEKREDNSKHQLLSPKPSETVFAGSDRNNQLDDDLLSALKSLELELESVRNKQGSSQPPTEHLIPTAPVIAQPHSTKDNIAPEEVTKIIALQQLAKQGDANAQHLLGCCYEEGSGIEKSLEQAVYWYEKAAKQEYAEAQSSLAWCYKKGLGVPIDQNKVTYWYKKAAEQGHTNSQFSTGWCYKAGLGVEKSDTLAVYWYQKAAENGHVKAMYNLGNYYKNGTGIEKDVVQAAQLFQKAASLGHADAQFNLSLCYLWGSGIQRNTELAKYWYQKAVDQGHPKAVQRPLIIKD